MESAERGRLSRRRALTLAAGALGASAIPARSGATTTIPLSLVGPIRQGGAAFGRTLAGAEILVDGKVETVASRRGRFVVGFDRDAPPEALIEARHEGASVRRTLQVAPGVWDEQRIDGLPPEQVSPTDPALLERIAREAALKRAALQSREPSDDFADGFQWPLERFRVSGRFGNRRVLNGEPKRPHYGIDLACPTGTPILAPAPGRVILAETDMHFEGGLVFVDHGQGLISMYLHLSRVLARVGDKLALGERIGRAGSTGRATGPHLCWRLRWRDRNLDPSLLVNPDSI